MADPKQLLDETVERVRRLTKRRQDLDRLEERARQRRSIRENQASNTSSGETEPSE